MTALAITVGGVLLPPSELSDITFAVGFGGDGGGGLQSLSFTISNPAKLSVGQPVHLRSGLLDGGDGQISEVDYDTGEVTVQGSVVAGANFLAIDSTAANPAAPTNIPANAIASAVGLGWVNPGIAALNAAVTSLPTDSWSTMPDIMKAACSAQTTPSYWGLDGNSNVYLVQQPTTPSLRIRPPQKVSPKASDSYVTQLFVKYRDSANPVTADGQVKYSALTVSSNVSLPTRQATADITDKGLLTAAQATTIGQQLLAQYGPAWVLTDSVTLTADDMTAMSGISSDPAAVAIAAATGLMVRHAGMRSPSGAQQFDTFDWVVGTASYDDSAHAVTLTPLNAGVMDAYSAIRSIAQTTADNATLLDALVTNGGLIPVQFLPSSKLVRVFANYGSLPAAGDFVGQIVIINSDVDGNNGEWRWDGSVWRRFNIPPVAFTPTFSNISGGSGISKGGFFGVADGFCKGEAWETWTSPVTMTANPVELPLPIPAATFGPEYHGGRGRFYTGSLLLDIETWINVAGGVMDGYWLAGAAGSPSFSAWNGNGLSVPALSGTGGVHMQFDYPIA